VTFSVGGCGEGQETQAAVKDLHSPLSQIDGCGTLPVDTNKEAHRGTGQKGFARAASGETARRLEPPMPGLWQEVGDEHGGRRMVPLAAVPLVQLALGAQRNLLTQGARIDSSTVDRASAPSSLPGAGEQR